MTVCGSVFHHSYLDMKVDVNVDGNEGVHVEAMIVRKLAMAENNFSVSIAGFTGATSEMKPVFFPVYGSRKKPHNSIFCDGTLSGVDPPAVCWFIQTRLSSYRKDSHSFSTPSMYNVSVWLTSKLRNLRAENWYCGA